MDDEINVIEYVAGRDVDEAQAALLAQQGQAQEALWLGRRGYGVGWVAQTRPHELPSRVSIRQRWQASQAVVLPSYFAAELADKHGDIAAAHQLMQNVAEGAELAELMADPVYSSRISPRFDPLAATFDEGDEQEIETLEFDVYEAQERVAENLWMKASWLSFDESDASLRFRFSFGLAGDENVAADLVRQNYAAQLTEAIFPESSLISANADLAKLLQEILGLEQIAYVERIVYFNAPFGGAQMHHDVERGHEGVVYAQLSGSTAWLALSKAELIAEIGYFFQREDAEILLAEEVPEPQERARLKAWLVSSECLSDALDDRDNEPLEALINRVPVFAQQLVSKGYAFVLNPGDIILLPQQNLAHCAWHSVFCLSEDEGEALSFAIRGVAKNEK